MTAVARAIFLVPPFPSARPQDIVRPAGGKANNDGSSVSPDTLIAALRQHRVGGAYWQDGDANPWHPAENISVFHSEDGLALLAAIAGRKVKIEGDGPFAVLSEKEPGEPETETLINALVAGHLLDGVTYRDPFTGAPADPLDIIEILAAWRPAIEANRSIGAAFGFAQWKRGTIEPLLWGGSAVPFETARTSSLDSVPEQSSIAVWKARVPASFLAGLEHVSRRVVEVEDGFIRSVGLGADCVPPLSIVVDDLGVHYDPSRPNRLEAMLIEGDFSSDDLERAKALRGWLVREGISKYGIGSGTALSRPGGDKRHILVVGQVEDDRSVLLGGGPVRSNLELLRRVRALEPDAHLIYRPHPDVEAGHRRGAIPAQLTGKLANSIDPKSPISALIAMVDDVHVITSLAGFEALLHGKSVVTHGTPFFAGWGLTRDLTPPPSRRDQSRTIDELTAATLLRYPRYLDPVTSLPCTAEILVMRLLSGVQRQNVALVPLRRLVGWTKRALAQALRSQ